MGRSGTAMAVWPHPFLPSCSCWSRLACGEPASRLRGYGGMRWRRRGASWRGAALRRALVTVRYTKGCRGGHRASRRAPCLRRSSRSEQRRVRPRFCAGSPRGERVSTRRREALPGARRDAAGLLRAPDSRRGDEKRGTRLRAQLHPSKTTRRLEPAARIESPTEPRRSPALLRTSTRGACVPKRPQCLRRTASRSSVYPRARCRCSRCSRRR